MTDQLAWLHAFQGVILLTLLFFILRGKWLFIWGTFLMIFATLVTQKWAILAFIQVSQVIPFIQFSDYQISLLIDPLSALMISLINLVCILGWFYGRGYLKSYLSKKSQLEIAWHYFNYLWLYLSMLLVVMLRDGYAFLFAWEMMSLASFFLVVFENEKRENLEAATSYFIQMHLGMIFLLLGFMLAADNGGIFGFEGIKIYMAKNNNLWLFLLFFAGFGLKAGFIPLHTWLPQAHPVAPSHVSGVMSGIMIKLGIYGILRVIQSMHSEYMTIGIILIILSILSSVGGISLAAVQSDLKKVLAYSSIENIGILGMGLGLGLVGMATNIQLLTVLSYTSVIFHMINHALFKPLLFFGAGNVYQQLHHRNIEKMGGLGKLMPKTAVFFLVGSIAISGIPPFNGFISELFLYLGIFKTLNFGELAANVISLFVLAALVITGALASFAFIRLYSVVFQGYSRSENAAHAKEVKTSMLTIMGFIVVLLLSIGIFPHVWLYIPRQVVYSLLPGIEIHGLPIENILKNTGIVALGLIILSVLFGFARRRHIDKYGGKSSPTWGCGYVTHQPEAFQYTASSQSYYLNLQAPLVAGEKTDYEEMDKNDYFPLSRRYAIRRKDIIWQHIYYEPACFVATYLQKLAIFHTGRIQTYLLYALIFIVLIGLLTLFNLL